MNDVTLKGSFKMAANAHKVASTHANEQLTGLIKKIWDLKWAEKPNLMEEITIAIGDVQGEIRRHHAEFHHTMTAMGQESC